MKTSSVAETRCKLEPSSEEPSSTSAVHNDDPSLEQPQLRLERAARISRGPFQPIIQNYPVKIIGSGKSARMRSFNSAWYQDYKWMEYSPDKDAVFCFPCQFFGMNDSSSGTIKDAFISTGFSAWNRATEGFRKHETSKFHASSVVGWTSFINSKNVEVQVNTDKVAELKEKEKRRLKNWGYMARLIDIVKTLATGGQPSRGIHETDESCEKGLFLELVSLFKKYDTFFDCYLENGPANCAHLSSRIQNDITQALSNVMLRHIADEARGQPFSIIADLTYHEQLSFLIRYIPRDETRPIERFITVERLMKTDAQSIFDALKDILDQIGLLWEDVISVCFDGASIVSGQYSGVQAKCKEMNKAIMFVHCYAHCLNLSLVNTCTQFQENPMICDFFGALQLLYSLIEGDPKRHAIFEDISKQTDQKLKALKSLSDIRWACRSEAVSAVRIQFKSVVLAMEEILEDVTTNPKTRAKAIGLLHQIKSFHFVICLEIMHIVLKIVLITSKTLQNPDVDLCQVIDSVESLAIALVELKNDENHETKFDVLYQNAKSICEDIEIEMPVYKKRKLSERNGDNNPSSELYVQSKKEEIRLSTFYPVLDGMVEGLNDRFSKENKKIIRAVGKIIKLNVGPEKCTREDFEVLSKHFCLDQSHLEAEFLLLKTRKENGYPPESIPEWLEWLKENERYATFDTFQTLLAKFSTIPISSCTCERSFSKMTIATSKLRSTLCQGRLQHLMLPFVEQILAKDIRIDEIIEELKKIVHFTQGMAL